MDLIAKPEAGRVTARRLNRFEYTNTIRDLLGVQFSATAEFAADDSGYGFDNIGDVLTVSPLLFEKYLTAAREIASAAIPTLKPIEPTSKVYEAQGGDFPQTLETRHTFPVEGD